MVKLSIKHNIFTHFILKKEMSSQVLLDFEWGYKLKEITQEILYMLMLKNNIAFG